MASKVIAQEKKDAAVLRILQGKSTVSDERRRLNVTHEAIRKWRKDYLRRHPEAEPKPLDPAPAPTDHAPSPAPEPVQVDGGLDAARAAAGLPPSPAANAAPKVVQPQTQLVGPINLSTTQEDEDLVFFYAGLLVSGEIRIPLLLLTAKKPYKVVMTPELEARCVLSKGEREALKPACPYLARKIREWMGSSENAMLAGVVTALGFGAVDRITAVMAAVQSAAAEYEKSHGGQK